MLGYFYTESMAAERRQEEHRTQLGTLNAQLGLITMKNLLKTMSFLRTMKSDYKSFVSAKVLVPS